ncbi:MAG: lysophospholipid acyltransferase family protein [Verrucomicrobiia bacterium]
MQVREEHRNYRQRFSKRKRTSEIVKPHKARWWSQLFGSFIFYIIKLLSLTIRFKWHDYSGIKESKQSQHFIFCIWHNRLALSLILFERFIKKNFPNRRLAAMVSASRDGALLTHILELFGASPVRGSSSRRGHQALKEMISRARQGYDLAITPDGPRGPRYEVQYGVIDLSKITGYPIIPVSYSVRWRIRLKSWDRFIIPLPFSRCDVFLGKPIYVPSNSSDEEREYFRRHLESSLRKLTLD